MPSLHAARPSASSRALHALDRRVQRLVQRQLGPLTRQMASELQQALVYEPGVLIARYRALRPRWLTEGEAFLNAVAALALKTATIAFLRRARRQLGMRRLCQLFAAEDEIGEDAEDSPGVDTALAGVLMRLLYRPDAWGMTPLDRLTRQDTITSRELWTRLQESERLWQLFLITLGTLSVVRGTRIINALRQVEQTARKVLAEHPSQRRRFLEGLRRVREEARRTGEVAPRSVEELQKSAKEGYDAGRETIITEEMEQRALRRAEVLARTLAAQSFALASIALARQAGITHIRWELSGLHPRTDVCDSLEGVYPIDDVPAYPAHAR